MFKKKCRKLFTVFFNKVTASKYLRCAQFKQSTPCKPVKIATTGIGMNDK